MQQPSSASSAGPTSVRGVATLGVIVLAVASWMFVQRPSDGPMADLDQAPAGSNASDSSRFRSDAWFLPDDDRLGFVEIPAGPFAMGSDRDADLEAFENEWWGPGRLPGTVDLPTFSIGRYEVTVAQFAAYRRSTGVRVEADGPPGSPDHPVTTVSWPEALAYCRWLDTALRDWPDTPTELRRLLDDGWRVTLPSEAEWEKAARGPDGRIFPWGNEPRRDRANFDGTITNPVGTIACPECPFGLSDMSGNVWEWTRSPYLPYPFDPSASGIDLEADALWVMRGGHFGDSARYVRAAVRGGADPGARRSFIGFRVALSRF